MTPIQKKALLVLLRGGSIAKSGTHSFSVRDEKHNPIIRIRSQSFKTVGQLCKRKGSLHVIDKKKVIGLTMKSWVKQQYRILLKVKPCRPCKIESITLKKAQ